VKRFPFVLTFVALLAFLVLTGLGVWQVRRLAWKENLLARVATLRGAPPQPLETVLARARGGEDVAYHRVSVRCANPDGQTPVIFLYGIHDGQVAWRALDVCRLTAGPADAILIDRGVVTQFTGAPGPAATMLPPPGQIVGVLRSFGAKPLIGPVEATRTGGPRLFQALEGQAVADLLRSKGATRPAALFLAVESESPAIPGLAPEALPEDIPNNHFAYALTWFALAAVLAWFYGALLLRRLRSS